MDMKLDHAAIRQEREKRAWSQEHLAGVTGLSLRTIQRIESSGLASFDSASSIAAVYGVPVAVLRVEDAQPTERKNAAPRWLTWHRAGTVFACTLLAAILTPPNFIKTLAVAIVLWVGCELAIRTRRRI